MDDINERFKAKSGKFNGLGDDGDTWRMLYKKGGEDLLREYSEHMLTEHDYFAKQADAGFMSRLTMVVQSIWLPPERFWYYAFKRFSEQDRYFISGNKHCPEDLLEAIWIGDYRHVDNTPDPSAVAVCAYFNNYRKALSIYARRPDLRYVLSKRMRIQYEYSLRREGIIPVPDNALDICLNLRQTN
ncbi:MAG: hypothetical protein WCO71_05810 [Pseudomonadota bacterium]